MTVYLLCKAVVEFQVCLFFFSFLQKKRKRKKKEKKRGFTHTCSFCRIEDVGLRLVKYLVFKRIPDESYHRRLRSLLLCLCAVFVC